MKLKENQTQRIQNNCRALKPLIGKQADDLWQSYIFQDQEDQKDLAETIDLLSSSKLNQNVDNITPVFIPPSQKDSEGEFGLGDVLYNNEKRDAFGLRSKELFQHLAIFGRSGSGKTNLGFLFVKSLVDNKIPFLLFDWKRNYRDLLNMQRFQDLQIFTVGRDIAPFSFNPLIPPENVDPKTWLKKLIAVISHAHFLGEGVMYLLQHVLDDLYHKSGVYDQSVQKWPTFRDVLYQLQKLPIKGGRESLWLSSCMRAIASLCFGQSDQIFNSSANIGLHDLQQRNIVFELESLAQQDKVFFVQSVLLYAHMSKLAGSDKREELSNMIIIEEAHHILSKYSRKNSAAGESIIDIIMRELREFGTGICLMDQHPSEISLTALGNTYTTISMNLKSRQDVQTMASAMLLDQEQQDILGLMPVGQAVVKLQGRVPEPFMISVPEFKLQKGSVSDDLLKERMKPYLSQKTPQNASEALTGPERAFIIDIKDYPDSGVAERYKRLGISARQGDKIKKELLNKGIIREIEMITKTGRRKILELTDKGPKATNHYKNN